MHAVILAGGLGTRLRSVLPDTPKPMAPIQGRPFLALLIDYLALQGFTSVVLSVGYKYENIQSYFGSQYGAIDIRYSIESEPLGTGGAIKKSLSLVDGDSVFVLNGDTFLQLDYKRMLAGAVFRDSLLHIALRSVDDVSRYGAVKVDKNEIVSFSEKSGAAAGLINSGIYLLSPAIFESFDMPDKFSFEQDFIYQHLKSIRPISYVTEGYFIDIGVPEDYMRAQRELITVLGSK